MKCKKYNNFLQGCGYPPRVNCTTFVTLFSEIGTLFNCFVSRTEPELVISELDLTEVHRDLFYSLAVPVPCLALAFVYLLLAYKFIYNDDRNVKKVKQAMVTMRGIAEHRFCNVYRITVAQMASGWLTILRSWVQTPPGSS